MGFKVLIIAVSGRSPEHIHAAYGVISTGDFQYEGSLVMGRQLPDGTYCLHIVDEITPSDDVFAALSRDASLMACYVNEGVNDSYACSWRDGREAWHVWRSRGEGPRHLEVTGSPPPALQAISSELASKQDAADVKAKKHPDRGVDLMFDIPIALFTSLGGLRYDSVGLEDGEVWERLARPPAPKRGFYRLWPFRR